MKRSIVTISVCLNMALLAVFIFVRDFASGSLLKKEYTTRSQEVIRQTNILVLTNSLNSPESAKFNWREIESEDYPTYIANLRAVRCPEKTIFDIIFADIEKLFAEQKKQLEKKQKYWITGDDYEKAQLAKEENLFQLQEEKRDLIRRLLNSDLDWEVLHDWYEEDALGMFVGFLPDAQAERVLSVMKKYIDRFERVESRTRGLSIPEDADENQKIFAEMMAAVGQIISPSELEEGELRMVSLFGYLFSSSRLKESGLTGTELRHLMKLRKQVADPFMEQLSSFDGKESAPQIASNQEFLQRVREYLGENRFEQYLVAHDPGFRQLHGLARENGLQPKIAMGVYEIQQAVTLESLHVREDRTLRRADQRRELEAIEQSTRDALRQLLGEKLAASYLTNGGNWLQNIGKP